MPDVVGDSAPTAGSDLESAGLSVGTQTPQCSNVAGRDVVISTDPGPGDQVAPQSAVNLAVSTGPCQVG